MRAISRFVTLLVCASLLISMPPRIDYSVQHPKPGASVVFGDQALSPMAVSFRSLLHTSFRITSDLVQTAFSRQPAPILSVIARPVTVVFLFMLSLNLPFVSRPVEATGQLAPSFQMAAETRTAQLYREAKQSRSVPEIIQLLREIVDHHPESAEFPLALHDLWRWELAAKDPRALPDYLWHRQIAGLRDADYTPEDINQIEMLFRIAGAFEERRAFYEALISRPDLPAPTRLLIRTHLALSPIVFRHGDMRDIALRRDFPLEIHVDPNLSGQIASRVGPGARSPLYRALRQRDASYFVRLVEEMNRDILLPLTEGRFSVKPTIRFDGPNLSGEDMIEAVTRLRDMYRDKLGHQLTLILRGFTGAGFEGNEYLGDGLAVASPFGAQDPVSHARTLLDEKTFQTVLAHELCHSLGMFDTNSPRSILRFILPDLKNSGYAVLDGEDFTLVTFDNPDFVTRRQAPVMRISKTNRAAMGLGEPIAALATAAAPPLELDDAMITRVETFSIYYVASRPTQAVIRGPIMEAVERGMEPLQADEKERVEKLMDRLRELAVKMSEGRPAVNALRNLSSIRVVKEDPNLLLEPTSRSPLVRGLILRIRQNDQQEVIGFDLALHPSVFEAPNESDLVALLISGIANALTTDPVIGREWVRNMLTAYRDGLSEGEKKKQIDEYLQNVEAVWQSVPRAKITREGYARAWLIPLHWLGFGLARPIRRWLSYSKGRLRSRPFPHLSHILRAA